MEKFRIILLLLLTSLCIVSNASQTDVKAMTIEQMEAAESQAYLQQILSIEGFEDAEDCKAHKKDALMCSNFILNTPCESNEKSDLMWIYCARYVLLWDEKSDDILISFPKSSKEWMICPEIMSVFLAACTKTAIEDNIVGVYTKEMHIKSVTACTLYYIKYKKIMDTLCNPNMKKLVKLHRRGKLERFLSKQYDKDYKHVTQQTEKFFIPD
ncbi:MAG: hypothetical protein MJZ00_02510 [Paludibacteraceae bacterium]|nr:hypothetical protein [Paludibacteraceae bacterium]